MKPTKIEGIINPDGTPGYSWSPFIGCLNSCPYCWARKCLARSKCELCRKFTPHYHAERMDQPYTLKRPSTIAVCWMGDVWRYSALAKVLNEKGSKWGLHRSGLVGIMGELKQHTFLCLTRQPISYLCFCTTPPHPMAFSENVWLGVTVTCQEDVDRIGPDFAGIDHPQKFVSYEPMLGEIRDWGKMGRIGWLYMGARTDGRGRVKMEPDISWLVSARRAASDCGAKVWEKRSLSYLAAENMVELGGLELRKETPWLEI